MFLWLVSILFSKRMVTFSVQLGTFHTMCRNLTEQDLVLENFLKRNVAWENFLLSQETYRIPWWNDVCDREWVFCASELKNLTYKPYKDGLAYISRLVSIYSSCGGCPIRKKVLCSAQLVFNSRWDLDKNCCL